MDAAPLQAARDALAAAAQALAEAVGEAAEGEAGSGSPGLGGATRATPLPDGVSRLLQREGLAERLLGTAQAAAAQEPSGAPLAAADPAAETATLQSFARPPLSAEAAPPRPEAAPAMPVAEGRSGDFALPEAQLAPALLVGLQVDAGYGWTLPQPQPLQERARTQASEAEHEPGERSPRDEADEEAPGEEACAPAEAPAAPLVFDAADARLQALLRALHAALCAADAPPALRAAAEQWQRGRGVIVACPQAREPQGAAWAFVLAPQATAGRHGATVQLAGPCFEARLQWRETPRGERWCHARLVKEHHPRHGRRLVAADAAQAGACGVQLGPVLAEHRAPCAVTLRIAAARSFWNALGVQWSALLVVSALPLAGCTASVDEDAR